MTFFERYEKLCIARGYKPASQQAADALGTNRGTISAWKTSGSPPKTDFLVNIANVYHVSVDYLLCRTDDPTDYSDPDLIASLDGPQLDEFDGDVKKAVALQKAIAQDRRREATPMGVALYNQLDGIDKGKAEAFMQGLLAQDKYSAPAATGKKHA